MQIFQSIASEFYQNGLFIGSLGKVSNSPNEVISYNPQGRFLHPVIHFYANDQTEQVLAVRFATIRSYL